MGKRFLTADTHFGHYNIIRYCTRPFSSVEEMDKTLEENWNALVSYNDTIFHLGDFAFTKKEEQIYKLFERLHGNKILIKGNHDKKFILELPWKEVHRGAIEEDGATLVHNGEKFVFDNPSSHMSMIFSGNVHDIYKIKANILNVGCDVWHMRPVDFEVASSYWKYRFDYYLNHLRATGKGYADET